MNSRVQNNASGGSEHSVGLPTTNGKRHLPLPRGPHSVGFIDLMTPGMLLSRRDLVFTCGTNPGLWIENSDNLGVFSPSHMSRFLPIHLRSRIVVRQELDSSNMGAGCGVHYKVEEPDV